MNDLSAIYCLFVPCTVVGVEAVDMDIPSLCPRGSSQACWQRDHLKVVKPPG